MSLSPRLNARMSDIALSEEAVLQEEECSSHGMLINVSACASQMKLPESGVVSLRLKTVLG